MHSSLVPTVGLCTATTIPSTAVSCVGRSTNHAPAMDSSGASPAQNDRERNDNLGCHARPDRASLRKCSLDEILACAGMTFWDRMTGEKTKYYFRKLTKKIPSGKDQRGVIKHLSMLFSRRQFFLSPHIRLQDLGNQNAAIGLQIVFQ